MGRTSEAREQLLESACELIYARGYQSVGVQELCEHAGVKKGSFYHFFHSKQELALAMLDRHWEEMRSQMLEPCFAPDAPPLARIRRYLAAACESLAESKRVSGAVCGCPFGNLALEMSTEDAAIRQKLEEIFRSWAGYFESAIQEAINAGDLPALDVEVTAESLIAFLSGTALLAKTHDSADVAHRLVGSAGRLLGAPLPAIGS
jgi:TetR/AcrR family transcriptional repressor of nem operon